MARVVRAAIAALVVFVGFAAYYHATSDALPLGSGPDRRAHDDVVRFIYEHGRVARIPQDEDKLLFTAYGGTRALRPPLAYLTSAAIARAAEPAPERLEIIFRKGSAAFAALSVAVAFAALYAYLGAVWPAVAGAALLGLLPQLVFVASYNNDDAAAIFSGTLLLAVMLFVFRRGADLVGAVALGAAAGIVILTKQSAWLLLPGAAAFVLLFVRAPRRRLLGLAAAAAAAALAVCGWWLVSNMYHYGVSDPFLWNATREAAARHTQFADGTVHGYAAQGVSLFDLWLHNYDAFWTKTLHSTIGNLDLLRLRLGTWIYLLYGTVSGVALVYGVVRVFGIRRGRSDRDNRLRAFEGLLAAMLLFQLVGYTLTNLYNDVQLQGKYLLPCVLAVWVLFFSALCRAVRFVRERWFFDGRVCVGAPGAGRWALGAAVAMVLATHVYAWRAYVLPFYAPPVYAFQRGEYVTVRLPPDSIVGRHDIARLEIDGQTIRVTASGPDAHFVVDLGRHQWCEAVGGNRVMRVSLAGGAEGLFQVFFDDGSGFDEARSVHARYGPHRRVLEFVYGLRNCGRLRIDPIDREGTVTILGIELAELDVRELASRGDDYVPNNGGMQ